tara:strand:+ start:39 stop:317 length:279 start_codon:yes stop_codon:yes gene_type:complete
VRYLINNKKGEKMPELIKKTTLSFTDEELIALGEELMIARNAIKKVGKDIRLESNVYDKICEITRRKNIPFAPYESSRVKRVNRILEEAEVA